MGTNFNPIPRAQVLQRKWGSECTVSGCINNRSSGHMLCSRHKARLLYRGDVDQQLISVKQRNFGRKTVTLLFAENANNQSFKDLMAAVTDLWEIAQRNVAKELLLSDEGKPMIKLRRKALNICRAIFQDVKVMDALTVYCGFQFLQSYNPRLFVSDRAFEQTVSRALRNMANDFGATAGKTKSGHSQKFSMPLYETEGRVIWETFSGIFGTIGTRLHAQLTARAERLVKNKMSITKALKNIH